MIKASIVGASGYGGGELMRLLSSHPQVEIVAVTASQQQGRRVDESFPSLRSFSDLVMEAPHWEELARRSDVVFLALPHGLSQEGAPALLAAGARVIDIAADFRLRDAAVHERWYGAHRAPQLLAEAVYGLPELNAGAIAAARLVACPGCYPTAAILAVLPALGWREPGAPLVVDAKSGVSGAGRNPGANTHFGEVNENVKPYSAGRHRHTPEMQQAFADAGAGEAVWFTPHLIPMTRGILATCYLRTAAAVEQAEAEDVYRRCYESAPFVRLLTDKLPETKATQGSNFCDVAVLAAPADRLVIAFAALDNLVKGASGQAVQCMNLMFDLPQEEGLWAPPLFP
ncbi:MAG TPA: N-acetyl-gamma-glutamyl-phosphate reductase [Thermoanaerobaculia bacterium]|nr:N-acetyl-gamma-glutamyl-phosphate reductase [Thermoanaerobaculia bacterium]